MKKILFTAAVCCALLSPLLSQTKPGKAEKEKAPEYKSLTIPKFVPDVSIEEKVMEAIEKDITRQLNELSGEGWVVVDSSLSAFRLDHEVNHGERRTYHFTLRR